jgi:RNA polymerase sigma-70 factor (ECF subfamily)
MNATITEVLAAHRRGDPAAIELLITYCQKRIEYVAKNLLRGHPEVRRWEETADVVQRSSLRLVAALRALQPESECHLLRLAALQVRREVIDLVRHYAGPNSPVARLETNAFRKDGEVHMHVEHAPAKDADTAASGERWNRFHQAVAGLPDDERQVFEMRWYLGIDHATIANLTGWSTRTVKRRWQDAQAGINAALDGEPPN